MSTSDSENTESETNEEKQFRNWMCTLWLDDLSLYDIREGLRDLAAKYAIWQLECGEETARPHWQLYMELGRGVRLSTVRRYLPGGHYTCRRKSAEACRAYCSKEDTRIDGPWEHGTFSPSKPGRRTDVERLHEAVLGGEEYASLWRSQPSMLKYYRGVTEMRKALEQPRTNAMPSVFVLWGGTGTGKSARVEWIAPMAYRVPKPAKSSMPLWFDRYKGEEDVVFDDYYGGVTFSTLLVLLDRYPTTVDCRGGSYTWRAKRIFFTSNVEPQRWYPAVEPERLAALTRRFTAVYNVTSLDQALPSPFDTFDPSKFDM